MALEQFKTQVLLLHSQQSTLDALSASFGDRYAVHLATSGSEALTTLGETPIHVIVSAQDLPGMSGLEALREARKRSPDTIGILLAGSDRSDGLEALVSDKEVFQIVRGTVSPDALRDIIDTATQRVRLLTLSESANDLAANVDEPQGEHIVMETSPQGSSLISDGTARLSALRPRQERLASSASGREIDVLVLTKDEDFLETIRDSSLELHTVHHANTPAQAEAAVRDNKVGVLVTDAAMVGDQVSALTERLRRDQPRLVAVVAGRRDDGELLMDLINRGQVYRFLLKPVSPGRARLAIEASVKYHLEAPDAAFRNKANAEASAGGDTSKRRPARETAKVTPIGPGARPAPKAPGAVTPSSSSVTRKTEAKRSTAKTSQERPAVPPVQPDKAPPAPTVSAPKATRFGGFADPVRVRAVGASQRMAALRRRSLAVGTAVVAVAVLGWWFTRSAPDATDATPDQALEATTARGTDASPSVVESDIPAPPRGSPAGQRREMPAAPPAWQDTLDEARIARQAGEIVAPPGSNALELYAAVRTHAPEDPVIASEFAATVEDALALAEEALLQQDPAAAADTLRVVRLADPGNARLPFLDAQVAASQLRRSLDQARLAIRERRFEDAAGALQRARSAAGAESDELRVLTEELDSARSEQALDEVLLLAGERLEQNALTAPANDNARYYYELALSTAPENTVARQGLTIVAGKLVLSARESIDLGKLDEAERLLGDAAALDAKSEDLNASVQALANARAARQAALDAEAEAARQAEREAALRAEAEAKRQAELEREAALRAEAEAERQAELEREAALQAEAVEDAPLRTLPETGVANFPDAVSSEDAGSSPLQPAALADDSSADAVSSPVADSPDNLYSTAAFQEPAADGEPEGFAAEDGPSAAGSAAPQEHEPEYVAISTLTRTNYVAPTYPRSAQRRNITGWVDVAFTVNRRGSVENIQILDSGPGDIFVDAATDAVAQWHFEPAIVNRRPVEKQVAVRLNFSLE